MASSTKYYGLGFFDFGDPLGTDFAGNVEIDRWVFVDRQLFGLMSIFGNGVIDGWTVSAETAFSISIGEGNGNINFTAARTTFPQTISDLQPNTINYVFAKIKERTTFTEDIEFILLPTKNQNDPHFLLLAEVVVGAISIETINNDLRQTITFIELIKASIRLHRHRGGALNPSKIDLDSEVQGQLPSFRIADFDADKVTTGTFDLARMPIIDHQELSTVGLLTHPQLDTFVKTLESSNKEIFGEIGTSNLLQLILAMKFIYDDPSSAFFLSDRTVDENMINEISVIPGITPDTYIDFDNTTAEINLEQHYIQGIPPTTGTSFYVNFDTALAWNSAHLLENIIVDINSLVLAFRDDEETNIQTVEGFESATSHGQDLSNPSGTELFKKQTLILNDNAHILAEDVANGATNVIEGFYSGKFTHKQEFRNQYVKEYITAQDWTTFDAFVIHVKCSNTIHKPVKLYFENSFDPSDTSYKRSPDFIILDENEITNNPDDSDFEKRTVVLADLTFRNDIRKFTIFSDDLINEFHFFIDDITIQRAVLLPDNGTLLLRYSSGGSVTFSQIEWESSEPTGTGISVRARAATGTAFLTRSDYTPFLTSGDPINLEGTDIEVEVTFTPDSSNLISPSLRSLRILIISEAEIDGFKIDDTDEFSRGSSSNVTINSSPTSVSLTSPVEVGSYYFMLGNIFSQIHPETDSSGSTFAQGESALTAPVNAPISANQIFRAKENNSNDSISTSKFFDPRSSRRRPGKSVVIADTYNDRVLEFDTNGSLISGVGSINYTHDSKIFPISACVDTRTSILYIVWSQRISFKTVHVNKITMKGGGQDIQLIQDFDKIMGLTTSELESVEAEGQIMPIHLSSQNGGLSAQLPTFSNIIFTDTDVLDTGIDIDSVFYEAIITTNGIPLFIGKFAYIDGIFSPTWAEKTDDDSFVISNGTVAVKDYEFPTSITETITQSSNVSSIIEIDKNNNIIFGSNILSFSPFVPGRAEKISTNTLLLAGLKPGGSLGTTTEDKPFNFRSISGDDITKQQQKDVLHQLFQLGEKPFRGAVLLYNMQSKSTTFEYLSAEGILVSDVDIDSKDGSFVVAETSFQKSGRVIKLDSAGNITFSFGEGLYGIINDIEVQQDSSIVVST